MVEKPERPDLSKARARRDPVPAPDEGRDPIVPPEAEQKAEEQEEAAPARRGRPRKPVAIQFTNRLALDVHDKLQELVEEALYSDPSATIRSELEKAILDRHKRVFRR